MSDKAENVPLDLGDIIRRHEVMRMTGLKATSIWRLEKAGQFPRSIRITPKATGWLRSEVQEWIRNVAKNNRSRAASDAAPAAAGAQS